MDVINRSFLLYGELILLTSHYELQQQALLLEGGLMKLSLDDHAEYVLIIDLLLLHRTHQQVQPRHVLDMPRNALRLHPLLNHQHVDPENTPEAVNHREVFMRLIVAYLEGSHDLIEA
jgi:hypothetical protein